MKTNLIIILIAGIVFGLIQDSAVFIDTGGKPISGTRNAEIIVYENETGGEPIWRGYAGRDLPELSFVNGTPFNLEEMLPLEIATRELLWVEIVAEGITGVDRRLEISSAFARRVARHREIDTDEITETMDIGLVLGVPGEDLHVQSHNAGFGDSTPNERVTVAGAVSMQKATVPPTGSTGYGKVYVDDSSGHLMYMDEGGTPTDLLETSSAGVQSVSSSANPTGRTDHMRFIPGASTDITESATDDTIYISMNSGVSAPCSAPPDAPSTVEGPASVCEMAAGVGYSVPPVDGATYYFWSLPTESYIASGSGTNSVIVNFGSTDGDIVVHSHNSCGTSTTGITRTISMNHPPLMPGSITGSSSVCAGETEAYAIAPVAGATAYTWTLPSGAFIASGYGTNSVTITFAVSSGTVCVTADNSCGNSDPQCMPVTVFGSLSGVVPGAITGPSSICSGETDVTYTISEISDATTYNWTVPSGASIVSGTGTNSILVDYATTGGSVTVSASNSCGSSDSRSLAVAVSPNTVGGSISGTSNICLGSDTGTMTLSGNVGLVTKWQKSLDGGGWVDISRTEITYSETPAIAGTWEYRAEVRSGACDPAYSTAHSVVVAPTTVAGAVTGGSTPICQGNVTGTMTLSGHTGAVVKWQRSSDAGSSWTDIAHTSATYSETPPAGTFEYRAVVQSSPCSQENSASVEIVVTPTSVGGAITGAPASICLGSSTGLLTLSGHTGDVVKWQRSTDAGSSWTDISHTAATYSETPGMIGSYLYRAVVLSGVCSEVNSSNAGPIVVYPIPITDLSYDPGVPPIDFSVTFDPAETGATYSWTFEGGSPSSSTAENPSVTWSSSGTYDVSLEVTKNGCTDTKDTTITVRAAITQVFTYTGAMQSWTVPAGVTSVQIECWGAQGNGTGGGLGSYAIGNLAVTPGSSLSLYVGGQGGWNGGGTGASGGPTVGNSNGAAYYGGAGGAGYNGGGKSHVMYSAAEVITAGGGGGRGGGGGGAPGYGAGGVPGGATAPAGNGSPGGAGGTGGIGNGGAGANGGNGGGGASCGAGSYGRASTGPTGGAAGSNCYGTAATAGGSGSGANGGSGGTGGGGAGYGYQSGGSGGGGGGGGGGYAAGSGGGGGGGGGNPSNWSGSAAGGGGAGGQAGTSYIGGVSGGSITAASRSGNGQIIVTY